MKDRLNFFEPYDRLPPDHENQLTRALLVVLRCCPIAHQAWLSLIEPGLRLYDLPRPAFDTQRAQILRNDGQQPTDEQIKGLSVLCAADTQEGAKNAVLESDRGQVLDGIIRYGDEVVVVMESKLDGPADDRQARNINLHGQPIAFDGRVRRISWHKVLAIFTDLAHEERGLTSGAERVILTDFLDFVDRNFPRLGPFNTLQRCVAKPSRVDRRLRMILSAVLGGEGASLPGTRVTVTAAYLVYEKQEVQLRMYPADTLQQARIFYARPNAPERVLALEERGWRVSPNFHFGFATPGLAWTTTTASSAEYIRYWQQHIGNTGQVEQREWAQYWNMLVENRIAEPADREKFDRAFTNTKRQSASPRPGIGCVFTWTLAKAERLDASAQPPQMTDAVKERINELLIALEEAPLD